MTKKHYYPLHLKWHFTTRMGLLQLKTLMYSIYINIFGIFLRIPLLPLSFDKIGFDFWYRGDTVIWSWKKKKWVSLSFSGTGEFGDDACFDKLSDLDKMWDEFMVFENNNLTNNDYDVSLDKEIT